MTRPKHPQGQEDKPRKTGPPADSRSKSRKEKAASSSTASLGSKDELPSTYTASSDPGNGKAASTSSGSLGSKDEQPISTASSVPAKEKSYSASTTIGSLSATEETTTSTASSDRAKEKAASTSTASCSGSKDEPSSNASSAPGNEKGASTSTATSSGPGNDQSSTSTESSDPGKGKATSSCSASSESTDVLPSTSTISSMSQKHQMTFLSLNLGKAFGIGKKKEQSMEEVNRVVPLLIQKNVDVAFLHDVVRQIWDCSIDGFESIWQKEEKMNERRMQLLTLVKKGLQGDTKNLVPNIMLALPSINTINVDKKRGIQELETSLKAYEEFNGGFTPLILAGDLYEKEFDAYLERENFFDVMQSNTRMNAEVRKKFESARVSRMFIRNPNPEPSEEQMGQAKVLPEKIDKQVRMHVKRAFTVPHKLVACSNNIAVICSVTLQKDQQKHCETCNLWLTACIRCEETVHVHKAQNPSRSCNNDPKFIRPSGECNKCASYFCFKEKEHMTFLTLNLGKRVESKVLVDLLQQERVDVAFLQEALYSSWRKKLPEDDYKCFWEIGDKQKIKRGQLLTMVRKNLTIHKDEVYVRPPHEGGKNEFLRIMHTGPFMNIHNNISKFIWTREMIESYESLSGELEESAPLLVLAGDFNRVALPEDRLDKSGKFEKPVSKGLLELLHTEGLCDVMQVQSRKEFTRGRARLDQIYIRNPDLLSSNSGQVRMHVKNAFMIPYLYSDHDAVICKVELERGPPQKCDTCKLWLTTCNTCKQTVHVHLSTIFPAKCFLDAAFVTPSGNCNKCETKHKICVNCGTFLPFKTYGDQPLTVKCCVCEEEIHNKCASFQCYHGRRYTHTNMRTGNARQIVLCGRLDCKKKRRASL